MLIFGDNPVGWRFFGVLLGGIYVGLFYFTCRRLQMSRAACSIATFLLAVGNINFVHTGMAMLDVYSTFFMMLSFYLYASKQYVGAGIAVGLAGLAKLNGLFVILVIGAHFFYRLFMERGKPWKFIIMLFTAGASFILLMPLFDFLIGYQFFNPIDRLQTMNSMTNSLTFASVTHPSASYPWMWILRPEIIPYYFDPNYTSVVSYTVWGMIIPTVIYMIYRAIRGNNAGLFGALWFAGIYLVWMVLVLITNRIMYPYYMYPVVGGICLGLGLMFGQLITLWRYWRLRDPWCWTFLAKRATVLNKRTFRPLHFLFIHWPMGLIAAFLMAHMGIFVFLSPVFTT
jgi:dolichyl-phosphate-mannose-protein mannosyltransferase